MELEQRLQELEKIGKPRLSKASNGWHANIELPAPAGCTAKVASEFDHKTPSEAVAVMCQRMDDLRNNMGRIAHEEL